MTSMLHHPVCNMYTADSATKAIPATGILMSMPVLFKDAEGNTVAHSRETQAPTRGRLCYRVLGGKHSYAFIRTD